MFPSCVPTTQTQRFVRHNFLGLIFSWGPVRVRIAEHKFREGDVTRPCDHAIGGLFTVVPPATHATLRSLCFLALPMGMAPARCVNRMTGRRCHSWGRPGKVGKKRSRGQGTQPPKEDAAAEMRPKGRTARLYLRPPILILAGGAVVGARARGSNPAKSLRRRRNYVMHVILARCARHGLPYLRDSISLLKTCRTFSSPLSLSLSLSGRKMKHGRRRLARARRLTLQKSSQCRTLSLSLPQTLTAVALGAAAAGAGGMIAF